MISINLHQPGQLNCYVQLPNEWNELLPEEIMEIAKQQLLKGNTQPVARAALLRTLITIRSKQQKVNLPPDWYTRLNVEQAVIDGFPLLDFLYKENTLTKVPEPIIGRWPWALHFSNFENITCGEFEDAEIFFQQFFAEPEALPLANLASILWRQKATPYITKNKKGLFVTYKAEKMLPRFLKMEAHRLYAIFIWYAGCRSQLPKLFPTVHNKQGGTKQEPDMLAFTKCIHAGAGPKNGSRNDIRMMKLYEFMFDMEQEAIKAEEMQAEYDRINAQH